MTRETLTKNLKMLFAAHHYVVHSKDTKEIAKIINVSPVKLHQWMREHQEDWLECLAYWGTRTKIGDFGLAKNLWTEMVEKGEHINLVNYPDKPVKSLDEDGDPALFPLIQSHLFCMDNLSDAEVRECLFWDNNPVRYEGQQIRGYHWFAYPNEIEGIYSKVLARVNVLGGLVIGDGEDTSLVCI